MKIKSNSHRFGHFSKIYNDVLDTNSFGWQSSRRQSFIQRLYFEYEYTKQVKGKCFFYTLTYNNKSIPRYKTADGQFDNPCFFYDDIRLVTNGVISKVLQRKYGSRLRYFIACESGEGAGQRGEGYNPHYHCLFFVQPLHDDTNKPIYNGYKLISALEFRSLVRKVWQGAEYVDYKNARFGICKEGDNCGEVINVAPFRYCSKYVLKDSSESDFEIKLVEYWNREAKRSGITLHSIWIYYLYLKEFWTDEPHYIFNYFSLDKYNYWRHRTTDSDKSYFHYVTKYGSVQEKVTLTEFNIWFTDYYLKFFSHHKLLEYRRLYSPKPRFSKGLGEYGLHFIVDEDFNPHFNIPDKIDFDFQIPCQYYYRKKYYTVYKCDITGNPLYRLNDLGIKMKLNRLPVAVEKKCMLVDDAFAIVHNSHFTQDVLNYFYVFRRSQILNQLFENPFKSDIIRKYAIYDIVYRYRFYQDFDMIALNDDFTLSKVNVDYLKFLENDSYLFDYDNLTCFNRHFLSRVYDKHSFDFHPSIYPYISTFKAIDDMLFYVSQFRSECSKRKFLENKERCKLVKHYLHNT